jgi:hypothetical protein
MAKMMILRGNHGPFDDESGKTHNYKDGALHESAALEFAKRKGLEGFVLQISGDPPAKGNRSHSPQTLLALKTFREDSSITGLYGFSGGGYNVWWILRALQPEEYKRIEWIVVLGAPDRDESEYDKSGFQGAKWTLIYKKNPPGNSAQVPKGHDPHIYGPEWLLAQTAEPKK